MDGVLNDKPAFPRPGINRRQQTMYTQPHYETVAEALISSKPPSLYHGDEINKWRKEVETCITRFTNKDPKFNATKFMEACGYTP